MDARKRKALAEMTPARPGSTSNPIPSSSPAFATPAVPIRPAAEIEQQQQQQPQQQPQPKNPFGRPPLPTTTSNNDNNNATTTTTTITSRPASVLPVLIPPATLRPLAFRVFTKRHNLTLQGSALAALATFVGRHCGSGWRDEGLAEKVLDDAARRWKRAGGALIVDGGPDGTDFAAMLKDLAACMSGGRIVTATNNAAAAAASGGAAAAIRSRDASASESPVMPTLTRQGSSFGVSKMSLDSGGATKTSVVSSSGNGTVDSSMGGVTGTTQNGNEEYDGYDTRTKTDPREHLRVISAFEQPRLVYNATKRHFEKVSKAPSLFPDAATRTAFHKQRYHLVHQRLMRNEAFAAPTSVAARRVVPSLQRAASSFLSQQSYKLSDVTDLLGRPGSSHLLLGLLTVAPAGHYVLSDPSGSVALDLSLAVPTPDWAWVAPGMMVIADGTYEDEGHGGGAGGDKHAATSMVGSNQGIGGTIGGRFLASTIAGPPAERREKTLGIAGACENDEFIAASSGFGWVDFLGVGSEKSAGPQMRKAERHFQKAEDPGGRGRVIILGDLNLDVPETLDALRKVLGIYEADEPGTSPMAFVLTGNFVSAAGMGRRGKAGSIEYKENFDQLASALSDYPRLLASATFVFVPGDNDPWAAAFSASASTTLPRQPMPAQLTSRIRKVFQAANADRDKTSNANVEGEAVFTSNPARLSLFGPAQEMVILRDDMTGRVRRSLISFDSREEEEEEEQEDNAAGEHDAQMQVDTEVANEESHAPVAVGSKARKKTTDIGAKTARQLVKMVVDQSYLTPFSILNRPVLWDYASSLHMTPLPTAMVLMDTDAPPFALGYEGCFVMNPGRILVENRKGQARWIEYDAVTKRGKTMQIGF